MGNSQIGPYTYDPVTGLVSLSGTILPSSEYSPVFTLLGNGPVCTGIYCKMSNMIVLPNGTTVENRSSEGIVL
jgi:hypothetical protein